MKIVVLGAGIAGLSIARALCLRGCPPLVIAGGHCATAAGAGIVCSQFWDEGLRLHALKSQEIIASLVPTERCGMVQIALNQEHARLIDQIPDDPKIVPDDLLQMFAPTFRQRILHADFAVRDFWVSTVALLGELGQNVEIWRRRVEFPKLGSSKPVSLKAGVLQAGVSNLGVSNLGVSNLGVSNFGVSNFGISNFGVSNFGDSNVEYILCDGERVDFDLLILATGADGLIRSAPALRRAELAQLDLPIPCAFHVLDNGIYMRPNFGSSLLGDGDCIYDSGEIPENLDSSETFLSHSAELLAEMFGELSLELRHYSAGVLRFSENNRPIIGASGNVWIFTGFGGDGLALAPSMAEMLALEILQ